MEVTHLEDKDTHAVIGGNNVRSFGLSDNAEFITMLSEGLYSNKMLAVVREVICNAYDAHVAANKKDIPIKITLNDTKLIIKDYGKGIDDKVIGPIYCVYGNSTKKHDGEANGGFGLGSKAPFAYTNHFVVTSCFQGTKTIYAVSRGSSETQGKPDMRTMATVPTTDTGLEVSIPLIDEDDIDIFTKYIKQIVYFGEIKAELNGELLEVLEISKSDSNFAIIKKNSKTFFNRDYFTSPIYVLYGTVIYPVPIDDTYKDNFKMLSGMLNQQILIVKAKPNTIAVLPTRETLSLTNRTKETISNLLNTINISFDHLYEPVYKELIELYGSKANQKQLVNMCVANDDIFDSNIFDEIRQKPITNSYDFVKFCLINSNNIRNIKINTQDFTYQKFKLINNTQIKYDKQNIYYYRLLRRYYKSAFNKSKINFKRGGYINFWNQLHLTKLKNNIPEEFHKYIRFKINDTYRSNDNSINNIFSLDEFTNHERNYNISYARQKRFDGINDAINSNPLSFNQVTISYNQRELYDDTAKYIDYLSIIIIIPRNSKKESEIIDKCKTFFTSIQDLRTEVVKLVPVIGATPAPKRVKGYLALSGVLSQSGNYLGNKFSDPEYPRIEKPEAVSVQRTEDKEPIVDGFKNVNLKLVTNFIPNVVVVSNTTTRDNLNSQKIPNLSDAIKYKFNIILKTHPGFINDLYNQSTTFHDDIISNLIKLSDDIPELKTMMRLPVNSNINQKHIDAIKLYDLYLNTHTYTNNYSLKRYFERVKKVIDFKATKNPIFSKLEYDKIINKVDLDTIVSDIYVDKTKVKEYSSFVISLVKQGIEK